MRTQSTDRAAGISDAAVRAKTGKGWSDWFEILDAVDATKKTQPQIVAYLGEHHSTAPWWGQMVTVAYEQERGLRRKRQTTRGYQVSVSKTVGVPVSALYDAWQDATARHRWLPGADLTVRKATPDKSMRTTWTDGKTNVETNFYSKGEAKSQVTVQHSKLASAEEVTRMRDYWSDALGRLEQILEA